MSAVYLYNVSHYGYLSEFIIYNLSKKKNNDISVLLIDRGWFSGETQSFMSSVTAVPGFDYILFYNESEVNNHLGDLEKMICIYFDNLLSKCPYDITDFTTIITGFDTIHAFGIYLGIKKKHYIIFDDSLLSSIDNSSLLQSDKEYDLLLYKYKALSWQSEWVDSLICPCGHSVDELKSILHGYNSLCKERPIPDKPIEFFDVPDSYNRLNKSYKTEIKKFYKVNIKFKKCSLLLPTSFCYSSNYTAKKRIWTFEETFLYPYRFLLDIINIPLRNLIIKPHPNTGFGEVYLEKVFPEATYIPGYVPSNLLFIYDLKIDVALSPGSHSISTITANSMYSLPRSFFFQSNDYVKLAVIKYFASKMNYNVIFDEVYSDDLDESFVQLFYDHADSSESLIVRRCEKIGSTGDFEIYFEKPISTSDYISIKIEKQPINRYFVFDISDEWIYVRTKSDLSKYLSSNNEIILKHCCLKIALHPWELDNGCDSTLNDENQWDDYSLAIHGNVLARYRNIRNEEFVKKINSSKAELIEELYYDGRVDVCLDYAALSVNANNYEVFNKILKKELIQAEKGNFRSMGHLARLYRFGIGVEKDLEKSKSWYLKAIVGDVTWKNQFVDLLLEMGGTDNLSLAFDICKKHAESGSYDAMGRLARMHRDGIGTPKDFVLAEQWFEKAAKGANYWIKEHDELKCSGISNQNTLLDNISDMDYSAMGNLARSYRYGIGVEKDLEKSKSWYLKAIVGDVTWKNQFVDLLLEMGGTDNLSLAFDICKKHAESGSYDAMGRLARMYKNGNGVEKNLDLALYWYTHAISGAPGWINECRECIESTRCYTYAEEYKIIISDYASKDNYSAMGNLARSYRYGIGVEKDLEKSKSWYLKAIVGDVTWKNQFVDLLLEMGGTDNLSLAFDICKKHAESGSYDAMGRLARMYKNGNGVEKNLDLALYWYKKAILGNKNWISEYEGARVLVKNEER